MAASEIVVSIDRELLRELDRLVEQDVFASRSQAIEIAVRQKLARRRPGRLAVECPKLDPAEEQATAEEGFSGRAMQGGDAW